MNERLYNVWVRMYEDLFLADEEPMEPFVSLWCKAIPFLPAITIAKRYDRLEFTEAWIEPV